MCRRSSNPTDPPMYIINNTKDILSLRPFYQAEELKKVQPEDFPYDNFEVKIIDKQSKITQLNDENQETQVIENYKDKLRSQKANYKAQDEKSQEKKRYSLRPRK